MNIDEDPSLGIRVKLLDTQTGESKWLLDEWNPDWWIDGNGSCDCNRELFMGQDSGGDDENGVGCCLGSKRYLIIECSDPTISLRDLNQDYPEYLLHEYLPPEAL